LLQKCFQISRCCPRCGSGRRSSTRPCIRRRGGGWRDGRHGSSRSSSSRRAVTGGVRWIRADASVGWSKCAPAFLAASPSPTAAAGHESDSNPS
jgi:hypothetical protein